MPTAADLLDAYVRQFSSGASLRPTGLPGLDALLNGGLCAGELVEVCGSASSGKSYVALAAACSTLLLDGSSTVLYIATTLDSFAARARRLLAMSVSARVLGWLATAEEDRCPLSQVLPRCAAAQAAPDMDTDSALPVDSARVKDLVQKEVEQACAALRIVHALEWSRLQKILQALEKDTNAAAAAAAAAASSEGSSSSSSSSSTTSLPSPQARFLCSLRLVVLDCLPTAIYPVLGGARNHVGHAALSEVGSRLHRLASAHSLAALVLNSVVADRGGEEGSGSGGGSSGEPTGMRPSLGLTWSFIPDVSLLCTRQLALVRPSPQQEPALRDTLSFAVVKSGRLFIGPGRGGTAAAAAAAAPPSTQAAWDLVPEVLLL